MKNILGAFVILFLFSQPSVSEPNRTILNSPKEVHKTGSTFRLEARGSRNSSFYELDIELEGNILFSKAQTFEVDPLNSEIPYYNIQTVCHSANSQKSSC